MRWALEMSVLINGLLRPKRPFRADVALSWLPWSELYTPIEEQRRIESSFERKLADLEAARQARRRH